MKRRKRLHFQRILTASTVGPFQPLCRERSFPQNIRRSMTYVGDVLEPIVREAQHRLLFLQEQLDLPAQRVQFDHLADTHLGGVGHQDFHIVGSRCRRAMRDVEPIPKR